MSFFEINQYKDRRQYYQCVLIVLFFVLVSFKDLLPELTGLITVISFVFLALNFMLLRHFDVEINFLYLLGLLLIYIVLSFIVYDFEVSRFLLGLWFSFAFILYFLIYSNVELDFEYFVSLVKSLAVLLGITSILGLVFAIIDPQVTDVQSSFAFMRGQSVYFGTSVLFYSSIAFLVVILLFLNLLLNKKEFLFAAIFFTFLVLSTLSRKLILALILIWFMWSVYKYEGFMNRMIMLALYLGVLVTIVYLFYEEISLRINHLHYYFDLDENNVAARTILLLTSFDIARDYFPFGSGLGTFGSVPAAVMYSPVYYDYSLNMIWGLSSEARHSDANFLTDTFFPQIIGELGIFGALLWLIIFSYPWYKSYQIYKIERLTFNSRKVIPLWFLICSLFLIVIVESTGSPLIISPMGLLIVFGLGGLCYRQLRRFRELHE